jgi:hypothetical protein
VSAASRAGLVGRQFPVLVLVEFRERLNRVFHLGSRNDAVAIGI